MKTKIIGIFVITLLIGTAIPAIGITIEKEIETQNSNNSPLQGDNIDQQMTTDCGYGFPLSPPFWQAQEFKPTMEDLKLVQLKMFKYSDPPAGIEITVSIRDDLNGNDLTAKTINADQISKKKKWVSFDFDDITVTPEEIYYIVSRSNGGDADNAYCWLFDYDNPYPRGIAWQSDNSGTNWYDLEEYSDIKEIDFCFKTYHEKSRDRTINTPFLNFLQKYPNLFPILQLLLQRLL